MSMFIKLKVPLLPAENTALEIMALGERRGAEAQAAWIIRAELQRRGLLVVEEPKPSAPKQLVSSVDRGRGA